MTGWTTSVPHGGPYTVPGSPRTDDVAQFRHNATGRWDVPGWDRQPPMPASNARHTSVCGFTHFIIAGLSLGWGLYP
jgi:hypothetical protein